MVALGGWFDVRALMSAPWYPDERVYLAAGWAYVHGDLTTNREHPPLGKFLIGVTELATGRGPEARVVDLVASLVTGVLVALIVYRLYGRWAGLCGLAAWTLLPHRVQPDVMRFDTLLFLDPLMVAFAVGALYAALRRHPVIAGVLIGAAAATKVPGALYLPAALVLCDRGRARLALSAVGAFAAAYVPYGLGAPGALAYMLRFQLGAAASGHRVLVAGHLEQHAPWWSHLSWQWHALGTTAAVVVAVTAAAGVATMQQRRVSVGLALAVVAPVTALSAFGVKLPYYYFDWAAPLTLLSVAGAVMTSVWCRRWLVGAVRVPVLAEQGPANR